MKTRYEIQVVNAVPSLDPSGAHATYDTGFGPSAEISGDGGSGSGVLDWKQARFEG